MEMLALRASLAERDYKNINLELRKKIKDPQSQVHLKGEEKETEVFFQNVRFGRKNVFQNSVLWRLHRKSRRMKRICRNRKSVLRLS